MLGSKNGSQGWKVRCRDCCSFGVSQKTDTCFELREVPNHSLATDLVFQLILVIIDVPGAGLKPDLISGNKGALPGRPISFLFLDRQEAELHTAA